MALISDTYGEAIQAETRAWGEIKKGFTHFADGDVVLAKITPCFQNGKSAVVRGLTNSIGAGTTELHVIRPIAETMYPEYVLIYFRSPGFLNNGVEKMTGSAGQKRVPREYVAYNPFPLPPLAEQRRIVAKVDQLMGLCDELESRQQAKRAARERLVASALDKLLSARDAAERAEHWHRLRDHFDLLFDTPATIPQLRQAILQLAVQGQLVPQDPTDEPAAEFVRAIEEFKTVASRQSTRIEPLDSADAGFQLPSGWLAVRLGDLALNRDGERIPVSKEIRAARKGEYDYYGASGVIDSIDDFLFDKPLLLIGEDGANLINRSTPIAFIAKGKYWVNNHAHVLDGVSLNFLRYLELFVNAIDLKPYVTGTAQPKMNQAKMNSIPVALPLLAEQKRIVAKVDQLLSLCDALEAKLTQSQSASESLVSAAVHHLLSKTARTEPIVKKTWIRCIKQCKSLQHIGLHGSSRPRHFLAPWWGLKSVTQNFNVHDHVKILRAKFQSDGPD
ncbi:MAG: restriction endonuclease subunit S [Planctomycetes bacterium]|nr:restriction endonuclease subunit S [Planctomycetota bacterium]